MHIGTIHALLPTLLNLPKLLTVLTLRMALALPMLLMPSALSTLPVAR